MSNLTNDIIKTSRQFSFLYISMRTAYIQRYLIKGNCTYHTNAVLERLNISKFRQFTNIFE